MTSDKLQVGSRLLVAATFLLLIAGGLVTSTGSGLAVPDWPLSYGQWMPPMVGGILYEHGHRMIAATVGLLTLILTLWIGFSEKRRWVRLLAIAAFAAVVLQGILGGLTVLWQLPAAVSVAHAMLGQTFFVLVALLATIYGGQLPTRGARACRGRAPVLSSAGLRGIPEDSIPPVALGSAKSPFHNLARQAGLPYGGFEMNSKIRLWSLTAHLAPSACGQPWGPSARLPRRHGGHLPQDQTHPSPGGGQTVPLARGPLALAATFTVATIYGQLILGAALRHAGWSPLSVCAHAVGAVVVVASVAWLARIVLAQPAAPWAVRRTLWLIGLVFVQLALGLITWLGHRPVWAATAHVAVGALLLANAAVLTYHAVPGTKMAKLFQSFVKMVPGTAYWELTKLRLTGLAVLTTFAGFYLGSPGPMEFPRLMATLLGAGLLGGGAAALNQVLEREADARMIRTCSRPLPTGRISPEAARLFGVILAGVGLGALAFVNWIAALLGVATLVTYLSLYTPLKTRTPLCTLVGAIPGALPPLIGWAAARGALGVESSVLFATLFLWQLPHFLALAWLYREDYARAGFRMLPIVDPAGGTVGRQIALSCLALVPVSLVPTVVQVSGGLYFFGALGLSLLLLGAGVQAARTLTAVATRRLFFISLAYLPSLLTVMALDKATSS